MSDDYTETRRALRPERRGGETEDEITGLEEAAESPRIPRPEKSASHDDE